MVGTNDHRCVWQNLDMAAAKVSQWIRDFHGHHGGQSVSFMVTPYYYIPIDRPNFLNSSSLLDAASE